MLSGGGNAGNWAVRLIQVPRALPGQESCTENECSSDDDSHAADEKRMRLPDGGPSGVTLAIQQEVGACHLSATGSPDPSIGATAIEVVGGNSRGFRIVRMALATDEGTTMFASTSQERASAAIRSRF